MLGGGSLPSRGAWIEIRLAAPVSDVMRVAPLAGSVDRNYLLHKKKLLAIVAPLAGSVDRNLLAQITWSYWDNVAPLAGSVDRNQLDTKGPARLAVAPLAGSVDRNQQSRRLNRIP